jgi:DNA-binding PadR family transcriptional regulator
MSPNAFLGEFEQMLLLAILQAGDDAFALTIRRELEQRSGRRVSRGAFYTTLDRLEGKGYLRWDERPVEPGRGGRPQRHFAVTEAGRAELRKAHRAFVRLWSGLEDHLG